MRIETVPALVDRAVTLSRGDAIVMPEERIRYDELPDRTMAFARRLLGTGVRPGDHVGLMLGDTIEYLVALLATMRLGVVPVPVNGRFKVRELKHVVNHSRMTLLIADPEYSALIAESDVPAGCGVVEGLANPAFVEGGTTIDPDEVEAAVARVRPDDDALILYTSGTTANPKGCVYKHSGVAAQAFAYAGSIDLGPGDRFFTPLPFFHVSAIVTLAAALTAPCALVHVGRRFDPELALDMLERERCTVSFTAFETIWMPVLNVPRFPEADLSALRLVINVGTPGSLQKMQDRFPSVPEVSSFGGTETGGFAAMGRAEDPPGPRLSMAGKPVAGAELRVVDPETGVDREPGVIGEILMRGPTRFHRYLYDPEQTALAIDEEGWFHSGDLGHFDEEGRIAFDGRLKDMLKVGGENVAAVEIETHLLTHPAVEIVQVVGAPDARYAEVPAAFVQLAPGAVVTEQELIDHCRGQIATWKVPRYVRFVGEWPMSGTKIQKFRLRQAITEELEAAGITEAPKIASR